MFEKIALDRGNSVWIKCFSGKSLNRMSCDMSRDVC